MALTLAPKAYDLLASKYAHEKFYSGVIGPIELNLPQICHSSNGTVALAHVAPTLEPKAYGLSIINDEYENK
jgi:hypothetical protein